MHLNIPLTPMSHWYLSHINCFKPINIYHFIVYNRKLVFSIFQNIPFRTIMSSIKAEDTIYGYNNSHLNDYQFYSNFLILTNNSSCKSLVKISDFWFYDSVLIITNSLPTFFQNQWYSTEIWFYVELIIGLFDTTMAPLFSS